jgi:transcription elongation factor Elf1
MILRIACPDCNHVGIVDAETLPRLLTCSACSSSRRVEVKDGRRMASAEAVMERLAGERERPQVRRIQ